MHGGREVLLTQGRLNVRPSGRRVLTQAQFRFRFYGQFCTEKGKENENAHIFFGRKIKCRKIKNMLFLVPKKKKKTKFGRPLLQYLVFLSFLLFRRTISGVARGAEEADRPGRQ